MKAKNIILLLIVNYSLFMLASCSVNKAKVDNSLKKYFDSANVEGCFTLLDNVTGQVTVYNMQLDTVRFTPASTFKIVNSLVGLQTGAITNDTMMIKWDGIVRTPDTWNKDLGMREAFKLSSVPYYQEVARRIGKDTLQKWLDTLSYGNKKIGGTRADTFWLDNSLKISADEQLGLMKKIVVEIIIHNLYHYEFLHSPNSILKLVMLFNILPITYFSWKIFLTSCLAYFLVSLLPIFSSLTIPFRSISAATTYLVGSKWL